MWQYRCELIKAVDGDTVDVSVDLGFKTYRTTRIRLAGVDTPERGQPGFYEATQFVERWFEQQSQLQHFEYHTLESIKTGKYGRWLGYFLEHDERGLYVSHKLGADLNKDMAGHGLMTLNARLLQAGLAVPYGS